MTAGDLYTAAGAVPVSTAAGLGNGTRWVVTRVGTPTGVAVSRSGALYFSDGSLDTVRVIGGGLSVTRFGRRTFLASSGGVAAAPPWPARCRRWRLPAGGEDAARPLGERAAVFGRPPSGPPARRRAHGQRPRRPSASTPTTARSPGPPAPGRAVTQTAYRIVVRRTDPGHTGTVWDSGTVRPPSRPSSPTADRRWPPTPPTSGPCRPRARPSGGGRSGSGPLHHGLRAADWQAQWLQPAGASAQPDRVTLPAHRGHPAGRHPAAGHGVRLRRPHLPPVRQRRRRRRLAQLLLSRRAVRPRRRPHRRPRRRAANALGVLHRWYGPGQGRPASSPGLLLQVSLWYDDGRHSWRDRRHLARAPGRMAAVAPTQLRRRRLRRVDRRAGPSPGLVEPRLRRQRLVAGHGDRAGRHGAVHPHLRAAHDIEETPVLPVRLHTLADGSVVADFGAVYAGAAAVEFARGIPGHGRHAGGLPARSRRPGLHAPRHAGDEPLLHLHHAGRPQAFEAFTYLGFRYLQIDNPGQRLEPGQVAAMARHTAMPAVPMATFSPGNRMLDAVWRLNARSCLYCSQEQFVDTPTREKGQFTWDAANESEAIMRVYGDQNLSWQGLRDVAARAGPLLARRRTNAVYPNGDGARFFATFTARYVEWLWRYYAATGDRPRRCCSTPRCPRWPTGCGRPARRGNGLLYGLADTSNGDPVYGYDLTVAADTASNVLAVNAFNRVAQLAGLAGDAAGAALAGAGCPAVAAVNAILRRSDGVYVDGVDAAARRARTPPRRRTPSRSAYGVVPGGRRRRGRRLRGRPRHHLGAEPRARAPARRWRRRAGPTPWCAR